jgi:prolyl-tRNA synthetase
VFFKGGSGRFIFAVIRGDLDVNETMLRNATGERTITPATTEEIKAIGAEPGYGSPVGVHDAFIVIDESIRDSPNLVAGANRPGWHLKNVNLGRDYQADLVADIATAEAGYPCPQCGHPLHATRAIEVGNIFKLGTRYSDKLGATYLDADGQSHPVVMGSYGIGPARSSASVVEQRHDDKGIIWPLSIAPYHVSLVELPSPDDPRPKEVAERLYQELEDVGVEVLYDDRDERPGVKFNDADLIGIPLRVAVSARNLKNDQIEIKQRTAKDATFVPVDQAVAEIVRMLAEIGENEAYEFGLDLEMTEPQI